MRTRSFKRVFKYGLTTLVLLITLASPLLTFANAKARYREQLDQFRVMIDEMAKLDLQNMAADDRSDVIKWLEEAEVFLARGDLGATGTRLKRIEYGLEMVRQITMVSQLQGQAQQQEQSFHSATEDMTKLQQEVQALKAKKTALDQELKSLR